MLVLVLVLVLYIFKEDDNFEKFSRFNAEKTISIRGRNYKLEV